MKERLQNIQTLLDQKQASAIFVTNPKNILYLTGFIGISPTERESTLLVTKEKAILFVPAMYEQRALELQKNSPHFEIVTDHERYGLLTSFTKYISNTDTVLLEAHNLTLAEFQKIQNSTQANLVPEKQLIEKFRAIKNEKEISFLKKACEITDQVFNEIVLLLQTTDYTKLTETDIADFMRTTGRKLGSEGFGFDPIIACGAGAAEPHYFTSNLPTGQAGKKQVTKNSCLLLDFGFLYHGYTADLSRTIFLGTAPEEFKKMYSLVKKNNEMCIEQCRVGMKAQDIYDISLEFFTQHGVEKKYLHSLGHGVGLDVHEAPSLGMNQQTVLEPNMVITIEPGLYFPNQFGVRIEDVIVVKETGIEVLSSGSSKELIEIE